MAIIRQPLHSALIASMEGELTFGILFQSQKHAAFILVYPILWVRSNSLIKQASSRNKSHWPLGRKGENKVPPQTIGREHMCDLARRCGDTMLNFCGITSVWQNRPHKSLPCFHAYPCQHTASGKSPMVPPAPLPGTCPCPTLTPNPKSTRSNSQPSWW